MIRRTIHEWQRIGYGDGERSIPERLADSIVSVAQRSTFAGRGGDGVLEYGRKGLRARGIVGVIATDVGQLEILPKIEGAGEQGASDITLRKRLIHMLGVVHDLPIDAGAMTQLGWQKDTVLELLIRLFCKRLADAVRQGMPRQYLAHEEDLSALRGRLNVTRQFSRHAVAPHKLACRFDDLSHDIALNQVMRAAIARLLSLSKAPDNLRTLRELSLAYADVSDVPVNALPWDQITLDRSNQRWQELLSFARLFLSDHHQQTSAGRVEGHALVFEMNVLFEKYVARMLHRALSGTDLRIASQGGHRDCLYDRDTGRFRTRPDIIIRQQGRPVLIIDTKWKRMTPRIDDPKQGVSQADVYQLMAYSQLYHCLNVMLLYPHHGGLGLDPVSQHFSIRAADANERLIVASIDLVQGKAVQTDWMSRLVRECLDLQG